MRAVPAWSISCRTIVLLGLLSLIPVFAAAEGLCLLAEPWDYGFGEVTAHVGEDEKLSVILSGCTEGSGIGWLIEDLQPGQTVRVAAMLRVIEARRPVYLVANGERLWTQSTDHRLVSFEYTLAPHEDSLTVWVWFDGRGDDEQAEVTDLQVTAVAKRPARLVVTGEASGEQIPVFWGAPAPLDDDPRAWYGLERVTYLFLGLGREVLGSTYTGPGRALVIGAPSGRFQIIYLGADTTVTTDVQSVGLVRAKARRWTYSLTGEQRVVETVEVVDGRFQIRLKRDEVAVVELFPTKERGFRVRRPERAMTAERIPAGPYHIAMWYPTWIGERGLAALGEYGSLIDEVNFFWYELRADGGLQHKGATPEDLDALAVAWEHGCLVMPTVTNGFSASLTHGVLASPSLRQRHIENLVELTVRHGYDGLDLDYESMDAADRDLFSQFVAELTSSMHHFGKLVSVTLHAKTSEPGGWSGPQAHDYQRLGRTADIVKLMAYDYSYSGGTAGPISPIGWVDQVLAFAHRLIPPRKLMIGLPWYGYDWPGGKPRATSLDLLRARQIIEVSGAKVQRDRHAEPFFRYRDEADVEHVVYFQDGTSYSARLQMIRTKYPDMLGIAHWQLGCEAPELWEVLEWLQR